MTIAPALTELSHPIDDLIPWPGNPREGDVGAISESLRRFGQQKPIVVQASTMHIVAGNHLWAAAKALGWQEVAANVVEMDDKTARAFLVADNRTAELGSYDEQGLADLLAQLAQEQNLEATGYDGDDVDELLKRLERETRQGDPDAVPEEPDEADVYVKPGDLWLLGDHRLLCGDTTSEVDVARLMDGERAALVFTDPPYGIDYRAMRRQDILPNDDTASSAYLVTVGALSAFPSDAVFVCCDWRSLSTMLDAFSEAGREPKSCIVWDKEHRTQNLDRFGKQHEFILYAGPFGGQPTVASDLWRHPRDFDPDHPTPKPVALVKQALESHDGLVIDPFAGSGTTIIAAEQLGRRCYAMEIEPKYVQVAIERWQDYTGKQARRGDEGD